MITAARKGPAVKEPPPSCDDPILIDTPISVSVRYTRGYGPLGLSCQPHVVGQRAGAFELSAVPLSLAQGHLSRSECHDLTAQDDRGVSATSSVRGEVHPL